MKKLEPRFHITEANRKMSVDFESICMNISRHLFGAPEVQLFLNDTDIRANIFCFRGRGFFLD